MRAGASRSGAGVCLTMLEALVRHTLPSCHKPRAGGPAGEWTLTAKMDERSIFVVYLLTGVSVSMTTVRSIRWIWNEGLMGIRYTGGGWSR